MLSGCEIVKSEAELEQLKGEIDTNNEIPGPVVSTDILRQSIPDELDLRKSKCMPKVKYQGKFKFLPFCWAELSCITTKMIQILTKEKNLIFLKLLGSTFKSNRNNLTTHVYYAL